MSYYVTHENSVLNINNAHLKVSGNVQTDVMKLGAIEFAPPASDVPGTVNFTNVTTGVTTTSNLNVGGTLQLGTVEVVATTHTLENTTALGNVTSNTIQFTNATTGIVTTGNVSVGKELTVTGNATVSSNLTVSGNVEVGTANLFVDTVNSMVGIRTTSPSFPLSVSDASVKKWNAFNNNTSAGDYTFTKSGIYLVGFMYGDGSDGNTCEYYTITAATSHGVNCGVTQHKNASSGYLNYAVQDHDTVRFWASSLPAGFNTSNYHLRIYFAGYS
jgi:hypothetical protein